MGDAFLTRETSIIAPTNLLEKNLVHLSGTTFNAFLVGMFTCIYTYTNFIILMIWSPSVAKFFENKTRKFSKNSSQGEYSKKSMEESLEKFLKRIDIRWQRDTVIAYANECVSAEGLNFLRLLPLWFMGYLRYFILVNFWDFSLRYI